MIIVNDVASMTSNVQYRVSWLTYRRNVDRDECITIHITRPPRVLWQPVTVCRRYILMKCSCWYLHKFTCFLWLLSSGTFSTIAMFWSMPKSCTRSSTSYCINFDKQIQCTDCLTDWLTDYPLQCQCIITKHKYLSVLTILHAYEFKQWSTNICIAYIQYRFKRDIVLS